MTQMECTKGRVRLTLRKAKNPGCAHRGLETSLKNNNNVQRREGAVQFPFHVNKAKVRHVLDHKRLKHDIQGQPGPKTQAHELWV